MSFCCKGGKAAVLWPTPRFATALGSGTSNAHVFLDTLVCNVAPSARLLHMPDPLPMAGGGGGRGPVAAAAVLPQGGLRVAWKHDAADAALPPDQLAGERWGGRAGVERQARCAYAVLVLSACLAMPPLPQSIAAGSVCPFQARCLFHAAASCAVPGSPATVPQSLSGWRRRRCPSSSAQPRTARVAPPPAPAPWPFAAPAPPWPTP